MPQNIIGVILAGGQGSRLDPLTRHRAKPAVPIGGKYRIIDFVIANFFNSNIRNLLVLTQYAQASLSQHIQTFWIPGTGFGESIEVMPPKMRSEDESRYLGTADAVWQNWDTISSKRYGPTHVAIFSGDHIYKMDIAQVLAYHREKRSSFTICVDVVPVEVAANQLGVVQVDANNRIIGFLEKPPLEDIPHLPKRPGWCYASMGNYIADSALLGTFLKEDANDDLSKHDFGKNVIPRMHEQQVRLYAYPSTLNEIEGQPEFFWRDVGTLQAYYQTCMEMLEFVPPLNLNNRHWPIPTYPDNLPSARLLGEDVHASHVSMSGGVVVDDAVVRWSTLGRNVFVQKGADVKGSHLFDDVIVGPNAQLRNVICDKDVVIPAGAVVGYNRAEDEARFGATTDLNGHGEWITVIPKGYEF
jgi:glucose-1-phosphate adenylyltransferase